MDLEEVQWCICTSKTFTKELGCISTSVYLKYKKCILSYIHENKARGVFLLLSLDQPPAVTRDIHSDYASVLVFIFTRKR